jgi:hypothetical protein
MPSVRDQMERAAREGSSRLNWQSVLLVVAFLSGWLGSDVWNDRFSEESERRENLVRSARQEIIDRYAAWEKKKPSALPCPLSCPPCEERGLTEVTDATSNGPLWLEDSVPNEARASAASAGAGSDLAASAAENLRGRQQ